MSVLMFSVPGDFTILYPDQDETYLMKFVKKATLNPVRCLPHPHKSVPTYILTKSINIACFYTFTTCCYRV